MDMKKSVNNDYGTKPSPRQQVPVGRAANQEELLARINKNITVTDHGTHPGGTPTHDATPTAQMKPMLPNSREGAEGNDQGYENSYQQRHPTDVDHQQDPDMMHGMNSTFDNLNNSLGAKENTLNMSTLKSD